MNALHNFTFIKLHVKMCREKGEESNLNNN